MKAITDTNAKKDLQGLIQKVCKNSEPVIIISNKSDDQAVLISLEDYQSLEETAYLLRTPANRAHLEKSLEQAKAGKLVCGKILQEGLGDSVGNISDQSHFVVSL